MFQYWNIELFSTFLLHFNILSHICKRVAQKSLNMFLESKSKRTYIGFENLKHIFFSFRGGGVEIMRIKYFCNVVVHWKAYTTPTNKVQKLLMVSCGVGFSTDYS